jgi:hypothetical protein
MRQDAPGFVAKPRVMHSERLEDSFPREPREARPAHASDDYGEEEVSAVGVRVLRAWLEVERVLMSESEERIGLVCDVLIFDTVERQHVLILA